MIHTILDTLIMIHTIMIHTISFLID